MRTHLVPTVSEWDAFVTRTYGPDALLHHANRLTACTRVMDRLAVTTVESLVTCQTCAGKAEPYWVGAR